ncbi:hypothetical protein PACTADRAFT_713 [Pachysolen tannophilus NRRL Y-2460]|uniref:Uncharacterized protein n=1 Tax=Pachysolen tannophilus NRRL Y-2460 TaxID=669874 RepID=A0A1E4U2K4_PACTA|nr:hypothetical protein PACTADRAFT_713 [Pachysolen tannophilus NRRL Y-2460]
MKKSGINSNNHSNINSNSSSSAVSSSLALTHSKPINFANDNNRKKSLTSSPSSAAHSSSISSLGIVENSRFKTANNSNTDTSFNDYQSNDGNICISSSESEEEVIPDQDISYIRNHKIGASANNSGNNSGSSSTDGFRKSMSNDDRAFNRKSFEEMFGMDFANINGNDFTPINSPSPVTTPSLQLPAAFPIGGYGGVKGSNNNGQYGTLEAMKTPGKSKTTKKKSPSIFLKKLSKSSLKLKPKAFNRLTNDLQAENMPLEAEINHEFAVTFALKDEEMLLNDGNITNNSINNSNGNGSRSTCFLQNSSLLQNEENMKKYELINRVNKQWSNKKNVISTNINGKFDNKISNSTDSDWMESPSSSNSGSATKNIGGTKRLAESVSSTNNNDTFRKRKSMDEDSDSYTSPSSNAKRRIVATTSPVLGVATSGIFSRRNSKLMQSASDDLEKMSL